MIACTHARLQVFYACCPYLIVTHFCANQAILEAFEGESEVHIVDLDIKQGLQWASLVQALALRKGGPPALLRITALAMPAVGAGAGGGGSASATATEELLATGARLREFADSVGVPLRVAVAAGWEAVERRPGEAVAVNCVSSLHALLAGGEEGGGEERVRAFLADVVAPWRPAVVTLVEQEGGGGGGGNGSGGEGTAASASSSSSFIPRFVDALHYYSSMFDSLASCLGGAPEERRVVESHLLAAHIVAAVGCADADPRMARHLPVHAWARIMEDAGFRPAPLSAHSIYQARFLVARFVASLQFPGDGSYTLAEHDGYLTLGWQDNPLYSVSCWS